MSDAAIAEAMRRETVRIASDELSADAAEMLWRFAYALCVTLREQGGKFDGRRHVRAPPPNEAPAALTAILTQADEDDVLIVYRYARNMLRVPRCMKKQRGADPLRSE